MRWIRRAGLTAILAASIAISTAAASGAATLAVPYSSVDAISAALAHPGANPPGANDWSCKPSAAHPYPVVLVHGTFANMTVNWNTLSPLLKNNGYCVFALNYGGLVAGQVGGLGDIEASASELAAFVNKVTSATGAPKVDIIGHSQGGMMPRYYIKFVDGASRVHTLVGLAPSNHGTTLLGLASLAAKFPWAAGLVLGSWCKACTQQIAGSDFMKKLNTGGDTVVGVNYTVIETGYDEVVTPYSSAWLSGTGVKNVKLQSQCSLDFSEHLSVAFDHIALRDVLNALDPAHPQSISCSYVAPVIGG